HSGFASGGSLDRPPLRTRWSRELGTSQSYPLIADGRVFVLHYEPAKASATLSALSAITGATLWTRPTGGGTHLAYDDGRLYGLDGEGLVSAFDPADGSILWTKSVQEPFDGTKPVAAGGKVYVYLSWSGGALRALDGETGKILWSNAAMYFGGSPAVDGRNVYVHDDYYCSTGAADRETGETRWVVGFDCWLGGSDVAANGAYVLTGAGQLLESGTGELRDGLYGGTPAIAGTTLLQLNGEVLQARNVRTGTTLWEFSGDGRLSGPPVVVNHVAYIGSSSGTLFGVDLHTGEQVWSTVLGTGTCSSYCSETPGPGAPGMAVGEGMLLVPVGGRLVALEDEVPLPVPGLDLEITSGPDGPTSDSGADFEYAATGAGFTYACRLDRSAWEPCDGSTSYDDLASGPHSFEVKTTGAGGDVALAARNWSVTGVPSTTIVSAPDALSNDPWPTFELEVTNAAVTHCRLDGGEWQRCGETVSYSYIGDGQHVFEARSTGGAGDVEDPPASHSWTMDTRGPDTTITSGTSGTTSSRSASFTFASDEVGVEFECALDGDPFAACTSPARYEELEDGEHAFRVRAVDAAGNADHWPEERKWTVQTSPGEPNTSMTSGPPTRTRSGHARFEFTSASDGATFECRLDDGIWNGCASPHEIDVADGTHRLDVRARKDGIADPSPASWAWTVDTTPPETTIDAAGTGPTEPSGYRVAFTASDSGARFRCRIDGGPWDPCTSPVVYGGLPPGSYTFEAAARDTVGNEDPTPASWTIVIEEDAGEEREGADAPRTVAAREDGVAPRDDGGSPPLGDAGSTVLVPAPAPSAPRAFARSVVESLAALRPSDVRSGARLMMRFAAPAAGVLRVAVVVRVGRREVVVGRGARRFRGRGEAFVGVRVTAAGRRLLARRRRLVVVARVTWTPAAGVPVRGAARGRR
ncbi:MAG TPA: PQQ-binding-like beta-propeller repeat protein, partial [Solirubrobacteraceae bacterium]|nr:PQQ-binding-like beta-propeller repeat protein [Solirubrobacteraceae bacterium]